MSGFPNRRSDTRHAAPRACVLLVDVQKDFWSALPAVRSAFPALPGNVSRLLACARQHPQLVQVVHVRAEYNATVSGTWFPWYKELDTLERSTSVTSEPEEFSRELQREIVGGRFSYDNSNDEPVVIKHTFDGFFETGLEELLRRRGVQRLFVAGLVTNCCVLSTATQAFLRGFEVVLLADCCGDRTLERHNFIVENFSYMWKVISVADFEQKLPELALTLHEAASEAQSSTGTVVTEESAAAAGTHGKPALVFGLIADVQYADRDDTFHPDDNNTTKRYRGALKHARAAGRAWERDGDVDFILQCGDIIDHSFSEKRNQECFEAVLSCLERPAVPVYHVLGNHCFAPGIDRGMLLSRLGIKGIQLGGPGTPRLGCYVRTTSAGLRMIVLDASDISTYGHPPGSPNAQAAEAWLREHSPGDAATPSAYGWNSAIGAVQLTWLERQLRECAARGERAIVVSHYPIDARAAAPTHLLWNGDEVCSVLSRFRDGTEADSGPGFVAAPPQFRFEAAARSAPPEPQLTNALDFLDCVKREYADRPEVYTEFLDLMKEFKSQDIDVDGVLTRVKQMFEGKDSLIEGFDVFLPPGYRIGLRGTDDDSQNDNNNNDGKAVEIERVVTAENGAERSEGGEHVPHPETDDAVATGSAEPRATNVVAAYICGHYHKGGYVFDRTTGTHFVTVEGILEAEPDKPCFARVEVFGDRLSIRGAGGVTSRDLLI